MIIEKISSFSKKHPLIVIFILMSITFFMGYNALDLDIDVSTERFLEKDNESFQFYQNIKNTYGNEDFSIIFFEDKSLFEKVKIKFYVDLIEKIEKIEGVEKVESVFNMTFIRNDDGMLNTNSIIDDELYLDDDYLTKIKDEVLRNKVFKNRLVSRDGTALIFKVQFTKNLKFNSLQQINNNILRDINHIRKYFRNVIYSGQTPTKITFKKMLEDDQGIIAPVSLLIIALIITVFLNNYAFFFLILFNSSVSLVILFGCMHFLNIPIHILTVIVPALIVIMGSTEDSHIVTEFIENKEKMNLEKSLTKTIKELSSILFLTSITTMLGMFSSYFSNIQALKEFGLIAGLGIAINFLVTIMFFPAYLKLFGHMFKSELLRIDKPLNKLANIIIFKHSATNLKKLVFIIILVTIFLAYFSSKVVVDNNVFNYFKNNSTIHKDSNTIKKSFPGINNILFIIDNREKDAFKKVINLNKIQDIIRVVQEEFPDAIFTSLIDKLLLVNQEMHEGDSNYFKLPVSNNQLAQYYLLLDHTDIHETISNDYTRFKFVLQHNIESSNVLNKKLEKVNQKINNLLKETNFSFALTGESYLINKATSELVFNQVSSIFLIIFVVFIVISIIFTNIKVGLIALTSNLIPVLAFYAILGILKIPLNIGTALVGAIALGIAIDDTLHLILRYNSELRKKNDERISIKNSLKKEMSPMFFTSIGLISGLAILSLSNLIPIIQFGLLSMFVIFIALLMDFFVTPSLLLLVKTITVWDLISLKFKSTDFKNSKVFEGMSLGEIKKIILLGDLKKYNKEEVIVEENELDDNIYIIVKGMVELFRTKDKEKLRIGVLQSGKEFGLNALGDKTPRFASAKVISNQAVILLLNNTLLKGLFKNYSKIGNKFSSNIMKTLCVRINNLISNNFMEDRRVNYREKEELEVKLVFNEIEYKFLTIDHSSSGLLIKPLSNNRPSNLKSGDTVDLEINYKNTFGLLPKKGIIRRFVNDSIGIQFINYEIDL